MTLAQIVVWVLVGLICGWAAGEVMVGRGFSLLGNIVVGIIGSLLGGFLFTLMDVQEGALIGSLITAFLGAVILLALVATIRRNAQHYDDM